MYNHSSRTAWLRGSARLCKLVLDVTLLLLAAAAEATQGPSATLPTPPRKLVYVTPLPPGHLATMNIEEQQSYTDALHTVSLGDLPTTTAPTPVGVYTTPLPLPLQTSSMSEVREQRVNRRIGTRARNRTGPAAVQTSTASTSSQQADASMQGSESAVATAPAMSSQPAKKKNKNKNNRRRKVSQKPATAGS